MVSTTSELIRRIDFFQSLDDRLVDSIARLCIRREYSPGAYIVRQGDPGLGLYVIASGSARVEISRDGVRTTIAELQAGEFVGELSVIDNQPRSANVVCTSNASCLLLTRDSFMKLIAKYPGITLHMAKTLAARLRAADDRMSEGRPETASQGPLSIALDSPSPTQMVPRSDKQRIKDLLTETISWAYLARSVTQFSLALVGCPVHVNLETAASRSLVKTVGSLKIVLVPAHESHLIGVHAFADGAFRATILQPLVTPGFTGLTVSRFTAPVRRNQSVWLPVPAMEGVRGESAAGPASGRNEMYDLEAALDL